MKHLQIPLILTLVACGTPPDETDTTDDTEVEDTDDTEVDTDDTEVDSDDTEVDTDDTDPPTPAELIGADSDLIAFYPFDGNANNAAGTGFNGTVAGATLTTDRDGNASSAYAFGGSDTITFGDIPLDSGSFTIAYWIKAPADMMNGELLRHLSKRPVCTVGHFFDFQASIAKDGSLTAGHEVRTSTVLESSIGAAATGMTKGVWHHVALVVDATAGKSASYVDGQLDQDRAFTVRDGETFNVANDADFGIGISPCIATDASLEAFRGSLDDIAVIGRALTADEVEAIAE